MIFNFVDDLKKCLKLAKSELANKGDLVWKKFIE